MFFLPHVPIREDQTSVNVLGCFLIVGNSKKFNNDFIGFSVMD